jgi:prolyl 4-hydroxylase
MREHEINKLDNFISGFYMDDTSICSELIVQHKMSKWKQRGRVGSGVSEMKKSTDSPMAENFDLQERFVGGPLQKAVELYYKKYEYANLYSPWYYKEANIQHYAPTEGFYGWHCERSSSVQEQNTRHLTFITYLNDVTDGGGTEFYYQNIKVNAEKGLTLIFPVDWTFTHRGIPSDTQDKYIVTGWYHYEEENQ